MRLTVLGSGGCMTIPKATCDCEICQEARAKGPPYERTGPAAFIKDQHLLIDAPAEINRQLNRADISRVDNLLFTHLDPDHIEGFRIVEQMTLDFRTWRNYPRKQVELVLPQGLMQRLEGVQTIYGSQLAYFKKQGYVRCRPFNSSTIIGGLKLTALPVHRGEQTAYVYVFEKNGRKLVFAVCDIRPFPENHPAVEKADLLVIQPGIFETGLKHGFIYPRDHVSRSTLYTFEETLALGRRIGAKKILFTHLEEYWNRSYDDYTALEAKYEGIRFAYDGLETEI